MTKKKTAKEFVEEVCNLVGSEYEFLEEYVNTRTKIRCRHNICKHEWDIAPNKFLQGRRCPECSKKIVAKRQTKTNEEFTKEVYNLTGDEYEFLEEYMNNRTKIKCKHSKCGYIWSIVPSSFLQGTRCPKCAGNNKKTNDDFTHEVLNLADGEYDVLGKYIGTLSKVLMKHNTCGHKWSISPSSFLSGKRCPKCAGNAKKRYGAV